VTARTIRWSNQKVINENVCQEPNENPNARSIYAVYLPDLVSIPTVDPVRNIRVAEKIKSSHTGTQLHKTDQDKWTAKSFCRKPANAAPLDEGGQDPNDNYNWHY
jgi:hypothetical protein